jgi:hypothetical protein
LILALRSKALDNNPKSMKTKVNFEVTGWEPTPYDESIESAKLSKVVIKKKITGEMEGDSVGDGIFCACADGSASYVVVERVTGKMGERKGTFVMQHGGIVNKGAVESQFGNIVPGSGTDGFEGLAGTVLFQHDESGAFIHLDLNIE